LAVEDRRPRRAGVRRFPDATRCRRDIPDLLVVRMHRDVADAAGRHRGPDRSEAKSGEGRAPAARRVALLSGGIRARWGRRWLSAGGWWLLSRERGCGEHDNKWSDD